MDPLNDNIVQLLGNSSDQFVAQLWRDTANVVGMQASDGAASSAAGKFGGQRPRKGMFRTVGQLYKVGVSEFVLELSATVCPYFFDND